jgi:hypothetical protein
MERTLVGDGNCHHNCPPGLWEMLIQYWRSPKGIRESEQMKEN